MQPTCLCYSRRIHITHFHPLIPLASALRNRGHKVAFATTAGFTDVVQSAGFHAYTAGVDPFNTWAWGEGVTRRKTRDLLRISHEFEFPDFIVRELTDFGALVAADVLGIPHVTVGAGLFITPRWWRSLLQGSLDRVRASYGLAADPHCQRLYPYLYCDTVPRWFQRLPAFPEVIHRFFRVEQDPEMHIPAPPWLTRLPCKPTVYVTLGTVYNKRPRLFRTLLRGLADEKITVICTVGTDQDPEELFLREQQTNVIVERYIPQGHVLPCCDAIVTHGGFSTLLGAIRNDVPPLVIPLGADQLVNARRCVQLGIGLALSQSRINVTTVRTALDALLCDTRFHRRLQQLKARDSDVPPIELAGLALERLARKGKSRPALPAVSLSFARRPP